MLEVVYNTLSFSTEFIIVSAVNQLLIQMQSVKANNLLICFYNWASIVHPFVNNFFLYFSFYGRKRFIRFHASVFSNSHDYQLIWAVNKTLFSNIAASKILPTFIMESRSSDYSNSRMVFSINNETMNTFSVYCKKFLSFLNIFNHIWNLKIKVNLEVIEGKSNLHKNLISNTIHKI